MEDSQKMSLLIESLNKKHGSDQIQFAEGRGGWPEATVRVLNGDFFVISFYGAHLLEWNSNGTEVFFLSEKADFSAGKAIRGGIPIIFPWFGKGENMPQPHGFARNLLWDFRSTLSNASENSITFGLSADEKTKALWPHDFDIEIKYILSEKLRSEVRIQNLSKEKIGAQLALHSYFAVSDLSVTSVTGLESCEYYDNAQSGIPLCPATNEPLQIEGLVDRFYQSIPGKVSINEGGKKTVEIESNLPERVCWNPGQEAIKKISDLQPEDYKKYVCVEAAEQKKNISLGPDEIFTCYQEISRL